VALPHRDERAPDDARGDHVAWVRDRLAGFLWSKQREILEAVVRHIRSQERS
jgi:hypothetical protein